MAKEVKFTIKLNVDGKEQVVDATTDVQKLSEELGIAKTRSDEVRNSLLKMNNVTQALRFEYHLNPNRFKRQNYKNSLF